MERITVDIQLGDGDTNAVFMPSKNLDKNNLQLIRHNTSLVKKLYPNINRARIQALKELTKQFSFSFASGDVIQLENGWFVTHTGLVRLARRKRCRGIHVEAVDSLCDSAANRFVLKATVYPSKDSAGFVATAMPIPQTFLCWSAVPRCGSRRHEPSIAHCGRLMVSGFARSRRSDRILVR